MRKGIFSLLALLLLRVGICDARQLPQLNPLLNAAKGRQVIEIPKGGYLLNNARDAAYPFTNLTNVEISGNGSEMILDRAGMKVSGLSVVGKEQY